MSTVTWTDGIPSAPVLLEEFRHGVLPAHRKTPGKKGSPFVVSPAAARKYAKNIGI